MKELLTNSVFFGVMVSILTYELGMFLKRKLKLAIFNPLLISIAAVIVCQRGARGILRESAGTIR